MNSIAFPQMFNSSSTRVVSDKEATEQNLLLLLSSDRGGLFGDPDFGSKITRFLFEQNNLVLQDIIIDDIYTAILQFIPQIQVDRKEIKVTSNGSKVQVHLKALNMLDYTTDLYTLNLLNYEDN